MLLLLHVLVSVRLNLLVDIVHVNVAMVRLHLVHFVRLLLMNKLRRALLGIHHGCIVTTMVCVNIEARVLIESCMLQLELLDGFNDLNSVKAHVDAEVKSKVFICNEFNHDTVEREFLKFGSILRQTQRMLQPVQSILRCPRLVMLLVQVGDVSGAHLSRLLCREGRGR